MSHRTLTTADRSALIKLASTHPTGSKERRAILARLSQKTAGYLLQDAWFDAEGERGTLSLEVEVPVRSVAPAGKSWPGGKAVGGLLDKMYNDLQNRVLKWSEDFEALGKAQGATLARVSIIENWTALTTNGSNIVIKSVWGFDTTFSNEKNRFWKPSAIESLYKTVSKMYGFRII